MRAAPARGPRSPGSRRARSHSGRTPFSCIGRIRVTLKWVGVRWWTDRPFRWAGGRDRSDHCRSAGDADDGGVEVLAAHRAPGGCAEGEDPTVRGDLVVAAGGRVEVHAHDGGVEVLAAHRAERRCAEGEYAAVRSGH